MSDIAPQISEEVQQTIDRFWSVFPSIWHQVRSHIHHEAAEDSAITVSQFHILRHINRGQDSVSELAATSHISRPAISRMVDVLVNKHLISRTQNPQDRRHVQLALTEAGETLLTTIVDNTHLWMSKKLVLLEGDELETIVSGMEALKKAFKE